MSMPQNKMATYTQEMGKAVQISSVDPGILEVGLQGLGKLTSRGVHGP